VTAQETKQVDKDRKIWQKGKGSKEKKRGRNKEISKFLETMEMLKELPAKAKRKVSTRMGRKIGWKHQCIIHNFNLLSNLPPQQHCMSS